MSVGELGLRQVWVKLGKGFGRDSIQCSSTEHQVAERNPTYFNISPTGEAGPHLTVTQGRVLSKSSSIRHGGYRKGKVHSILKHGGGGL